MEATVRAIMDTLSAMNIEPFVFVDRYQFTISQEKEMMNLAFSCIDQSDFLIAETSEKAIGVGVEAGYAKAKQKPIIYMRSSGAEHSTTMAGASNYQVVYDNTGDLQIQLKDVLSKMIEGCLFKQP